MLFLHKRLVDVKDSRSRIFGPIGRPKNSAPVSEMGSDETVMEISEITLASGDEQFQALSEITELYPLSWGVSSSNEGGS